MNQKRIIGVFLLVVLALVVLPKSLYHTHDEHIHSECDSHSSLEHLENHEECLVCQLAFTPFINETTQTELRKETELSDYTVSYTKAYFSHYISFRKGRAPPVNLV